MANLMLRNLNVYIILVNGFYHFPSPGVLHSSVLASWRVVFKQLCGDVDPRGIGIEIYFDGYDAKHEEGTGYGGNER